VVKLSIEVFQHLVILQYFSVFYYSAVYNNIIEIITFFKDSIYIRFNKNKCIK